MRNPAFRVARLLVAGAALALGPSCQFNQVVLLPELLDVNATTGLRYAFSTSVWASQVREATFFYWAEGYNSARNEIRVCGESASGDCAGEAYRIQPGCEPSGPAESRCRFELPPEVFGGFPCPVDGHPTVPCGEALNGRAVLTVVPANDEVGGLRIRDAALYLIYESALFPDA